MLWFVTWCLIETDLFKLNKKEDKSHGGTSYKWLQKIVLFIFHLNNYSFAFCRTPNNTRLVFQLFYLFLVRLLKSNCLLITTKGLISRCYLH